MAEAFNFNHDIKSANVYYEYRYCTKGKVRFTSIHVRDVKRLVLYGIYKIIYEDTKHRFIDIKSLFLNYTEPDGTPAKE